MSEYTIIDRRINSKGKNLSNRQRFLQRTKEWVKNKVRQKSLDRSITSEDGESISISKDDVSEPSFDYNRKVGEWDRVLPGNKDYIAGDTIERPSGGGSGKGGTASDSGEDEDDFVFTLTKEEYLDILFEDLELPDLVKTSETAATAFLKKRAGFSTAGTPNNLDLERSLKNAMGRRIALGIPLDRKIKEKEEELILAIDNEDRKRIMLEIEELKRRRNTVTYIDQVDVRYRRFNQVPLPNSQAVVFCLMDVSSSMGQKEKDIAKRFFLLLYLFLQRKYQKVDIVFVKHTTEAKECTEKEFFYDKESGGTLVSSGIKEINRIISQRYPTDMWNIYCVQASDGDNFDSDFSLLKNELDILLPLCQYYVYNEVTRQDTYGMAGMTMSNVHLTFEKLSKDYSNLSIIHIDGIEDVVPNFRKIFSKNQKNKK